MKLSVLIFITILFSEHAFSNNIDSLLVSVTDEEIHNFGVFVERKSKSNMEFYYENGVDEIGEKRVRGYVYYLEDTLYLKLFYYWEVEISPTWKTAPNSSTLTFDPIAISKGKQERIISRCFKKIARYKKVLCYEKTSKYYFDEYPDISERPEISEISYWYYLLKYRKKKPYVKVKRDKLSFKDRGYNSKKNKIKERKDFDEIKRSINIILVQYDYPLLN